LRKLQLDLHSGGPRSVGERRQLGQPRRCGLHVCVGAPHHTDHPPHLTQRVPPRGLDRLERLHRQVRVNGRQALSTLGLDHHHAHAVRDNVVKLPGDPGALVYPRLPRAFVAVALELGSSCA
jgi:hypothetical protein